MPRPVRTLGYAGALAALRSVPWHLASAVTPIFPMGHEALEFFPGQRGYSGEQFPSGGVMIVANNFDCLGGWSTYRDDLNYAPKSPTWKRMRNILVPASGIPLATFWFTNYCHGVMDSRDDDGNPDPCYSFPPQICKALEFRRVFEDCVFAMKPKVIVALGGDAAGHLKFNRGEAEHRIIGGHPTKVLAAYHTSARGTLEKFHADGARIRRAYYS